MLRKKKRTTTFDYLDNWKDKLRYKIYLLLFGKDDLIDTLFDILYKIITYYYDDKVDKEKIDEDLTFLIPYYEQLYIDLNMNEDKVRKLIEKDDSFQECLNDLRKKYKLEDSKINEILDEALINNFDKYYF
jgi:archaellum biogenesis protein FlaJ (TadC family)